ncbi:MAG: LON peptidase substrate-binding domain-containing protein [Emcibacteraceae bacterium]|nr:LON peptidase substrate-binding domain-containing protein [Emcibacteraceae bacterium]
MDKLPPQIPIFPLTGAVLFPRGFLPLNIYEPRYKEMIDVARTSHGIIGMVQPFGTRISSSTKNNDQFGTAKRGRDVYNVGCAGIISNFEENEQGQYFVILTGFRRFNIINELPLTNQFRVANVDYSDYQTDGAQKLETDSNLKDTFFNAFKDYLSAMHINIDVNSFKDAPAEELINSMAMICPFEASEKQLILEEVTLIERTNMMMKIMNINLSRHDISSDNKIH